MIRPALLAAILASTSMAAHAQPITVGASAGVTQAEANAKQDPDQAVALFGRLGLVRAIGVQLEMARIDGTESYVKTRSASVLAVADLATHGPWVPVILAGGGLDTAVVENSGEIHAHHVEVGLGLEYRAPGGFVAGADVRIGGRTVESNSTLVPLACCTYLASDHTLPDGQYRSARAFVGVRF